MSNQDDPTAKSDPATPYKVKEAKNKGHIFKSQELSACLIVLASILAMINTPWSKWLSSIDQWIVLSIHHNNDHDLLAQVGDMIVDIISVSAPFFIVIIISAIFVNVMQTGLRWVPAQILPTIDKISPAHGLKKIYQDNLLMETVKGLLKLMMLIILLLVQYQLILAFSEPWIRPIEQHFEFMLKQILTWLLPALFFLALIDYAWVRYRYFKKLRMTKQELKDEFKRREGDPKIKKKRRDYQRAWLDKVRGSSQVKSCDLVVVNPVHYAVSLLFDANHDIAPRVIAKGKNKWAEKIRSLAYQHHRPVIESASLARALYELPIGYAIPEAFYSQVGALYREHVITHEKLINGSLVESDEME